MRVKVVAQTAEMKIGGNSIEEVRDVFLKMMDLGEAGVFEKMVLIDMDNQSDPFGRINIDCETES